jgi:hypothetical protein
MCVGDTSGPTAALAVGAARERPRKATPMRVDARPAVRRLGVREGMGLLR